MLSRVTALEDTPMYQLTQLANCETLRPVSRNHGGGAVMRRRSLLATFAVVSVILAALAPASSAAPLASAPLASPSVRDWNLHASNALTNLPAAAIPGAVRSPVSSLHFAMVQGCRHDAVNAIDGTHRRTSLGLPPASRRPRSTRPWHTAAHNVLVGLVCQGPIRLSKLLPPAR